MGAQLGVTLPLDGLELHGHRAVLERLTAAGYGAVWTGEVNGIDALSPLALYAGWDDQVDVVSAVVNVFTRTPALLAMSAGALGEIAPGRSAFGIGAGSGVIVDTWNGMPFERPYTRVAETLRFVRRALAGEKVDGDWTTFRSEGFRLARRPEQPPALILAALGRRMIRLAAAEADGLVMNFVSAGDVAQVRDVVHRVDREADGSCDVSARIFVVPGDDEGATTTARRHLAGYLTVPVYAEYQRWLGRGEQLTGLWDAWAAGDRRRATAAIPQEVVDDLVVRGSDRSCADGVRRYLESGLDAVTIHLVPTPGMGPTAQTEFLVRLGDALR